MSGKIYRIKYRAANDVNPSDYTDATSIALADLPPAPNAPTKIDALSTETKIVLQWTAPTVSSSPGGDIIGYRLEMDDGLGGDFITVYDGYNAPSMIQFVVGGSPGTYPITPGRGYRFKISARVFNGLGPESSMTTIYSCTKPVGVQAPTLGTVLSNSMQIKWVEPTSNGACPILGYSMLMDDGLTGNPTVPVTMSNTVINYFVPTLRDVTISLNTANLGRTYTFKLRVDNLECTSTSVDTSFLFGIAPSKPPAGPTLIS